MKFSFTTTAAAAAAAMMVRPNHAIPLGKCSLTASDDKTYVMPADTDNLPSDVSYDATTGTLTCKGNGPGGSCSGSNVRIRSCQRVVGEGSESLSRSTLHNNKVVECKGEKACIGDAHEQRLVGNKEVECIGKDSCSARNLLGNERVYCLGFNSCYGSLISSTSAELHCLGTQSCAESTQSGNSVTKCVNTHPGVGDHACWNADIALPNNALLEVSGSAIDQSVVRSAKISAQGDGHGIQVICNGARSCGSTGPRHTGPEYIDIGQGELTCSTSTGVSACDKTSIRVQCVHCEPKSACGHQDVSYDYSSDGNYIYEILGCFGDASASKTALKPRDLTESGSGCEVGISICRED